MRVNVLQHTPNEGPGSIRTWAHRHHADLYIYHPYQFGSLPTAAETDLLIILGGPMSPNDKLPWIIRERKLIAQLLEQKKPIFGACFGAQQIVKTLGYPITKAPHKEVGWAPIYRQSNIIPNLPDRVEALHWHEEMFAIPAQAQLLFSSKLVANQGFLLGDRVIGLQCHLEPETDNLREMVVNDDQYPLDNNDLRQTPAQILAHGVPEQNKTVMFKLLDYITAGK